MRVNPTCPAVVSLILTVAASALVAQEPASAPASRRQPAGHADFGLPRPDAVWAPYHADPAHLLNRLFRAFYLVHAAPAEVATALPREHGDAADFFVPGWYFGKRAGEATDERWFGGDGRQMPREGFTAAEAAALREDLAAVDGEVVTALQATPRLAVWFQHDLLRMARRLLDTRQNPELLPLLVGAARRVALSRAVLESDALSTFRLADVQARQPELQVARMVELERRSTRLFDAEYVQLWSSVYLAVPETAASGLAPWLTPKGKGEKLASVPIGTQAVLVQGIVALDDEGNACATDVVIEVRTQVLRNRDPLAADNATTTRDGVDFAIWSLERQTLRERGAATSLADFRTVDMESQELFRDYGTRKHTTYAAQCTLCHRRSNGPEEELAGFPVLRSHVSPRPVADPQERRRKAEAEFEKFLAALAKTN